MSISPCVLIRFCTVPLAGGSVPPPSSHDAASIEALLHALAVNSSASAAANTGAVAGAVDSLPPAPLPFPFLPPHAMMMSQLPQPLPQPHGMRQQPPGFTDHRSSSVHSVPASSGVTAAGVAAGAAAGQVMSLAELEASLMAGGGDGGEQPAGSAGKKNTLQQAGSDSTQSSHRDAETFNHMALLLGRLGAGGGEQLQQNDSSRGELQIRQAGRASIADDEQQRASQHLMGILQFSSQGDGLAGMQPLSQQPFMTPFGHPMGIPPQHVQVGGPDTMFAPPHPMGQPHPDGAFRQHPVSSTHGPPPYRFAADMASSSMPPPHEANSSYYGSR